MSEKNEKSIYSFVGFSCKRVQPRSSFLLEPKPRSGHRIVCNDSDLYLFGGYNPHLAEDAIPDDPYWSESKPLMKELWKFNFGTKVWTKLCIHGDIPYALASHNIFIIGKNMLMSYGGTGTPFGAASSNKLHVCNLSELEWRHVNAGGNLPEEMYGQAVMRHKHFLYTVGGTTGYEYSIDIHRLNLISKEWQEIYIANGNEPNKRYRHEIGLFNNRIYILGGGTSTEVFDFETIPIFDLTLCKWANNVVVADPHFPIGRGIPQARRCHGCVQLDESVFISGGFDGIYVFSDIWRLNLKTLQWTKLPFSIPQPVYFHAATVTPAGCMYICGGVTHVQLNIRTSNLYSVWLKVPKLKEICWEAVSQYFPDLHTFSKERLLHLGIPQEFITRIKSD